MISRCNSPNGDYASIYYDRGIAVCDDWRRSFPSFRDWSLANGYAPNKTLDRRDNDKGYNPDNCRWATTKEQGRNKRHLKKIPAFAESKLLVEWSEDPRCPVSFNTLMCRIRKGWPAELAIVTPSGALRRGSLPSPLYSHVDQDTAHLKRALAD
jgi:hypothetical protein